MQFSGDDTSEITPSPLNAFSILSTPSSYIGSKAKNNPAQLVAFQSFQRGFDLLKFLCQAGLPFMPQSFVVDAVVAAVKELPHFPRLRVLDLSCGEAEILNRLKSLGCEVQGTHYRTDDYIVKDQQGLSNLKIYPGVDLHQPLPFADASFQVVILSEVLEHLEWHGTVIREAGRILEKGGYLLFTTPNIFRLHSRLQFFFTGKHKLIRRRLGWDLGYDERYAYHITPG